MKILLLSYGDYDYDGRLRELMRVFSSLGQMSAFTRGSIPLNVHHEIYHGGGGYAGFIFNAIKYGKRFGSVDVLVLDNRKAVIPGLILRFFLRPSVMIQDCRELYLPREVKHFAGEIGCFFEKLGIRKADVLICANQDRARFMKEMYHLEKAPLVYENLRRLEYSGKEAPDKQKKKFSKFLHKGELRLITTSGCSVSRTNDVLVRSLKQIKHPCRLFMVGENMPADQQAIERIIVENGLKNVEILGRLNQDELKYLISMCHIGIVNYHQKDHNNQYCASGKLFEFIYEGIPVVTTTNPPLLRLCKEYGIGIADDHYAAAINAIAADYSTYRTHVVEFAKTHTVQANNDRLQQELQLEIKRCLTSRA